MTDSFLGPNEEFERLLRERELLRVKLAELSSERETCLCVEGPNLQSLYYEKIGYLEVACLSAEMECARCKREIELITAATNRGTSWDYEEISRILDREFADWQAKVALEIKAVEKAKLRLSNLMNPESSKKFRELYRSLVKELHPDLHPTRHPRLRPLWDRLQRAYQAGDFEELELIAALLGGEEAVTLPASQELLREEIKLLKAKCKILIDALFSIRQKFPFTLADLLSDPVLLEAKQTTLQEKLHMSKDRRTALRSQLNLLLDGQ